MDIIHQVNEKSFELSKNIDIISYNEQPLKEIAANGIATISIDFAAMGTKMVDLIVNKKKEYIQNPFSFPKPSRCVYKFYKYPEYTFPMILKN